MLIFSMRLLAPLVKITCIDLSKIRHFLFICFIYPSFSEEPKNQMHSVSSPFPQLTFFFIVYILVLDSYCFSRRCLGASLLLVLLSCTFIIAAAHFMKVHSNVAARRLWRQSPHHDKFHVVPGSNVYIFGWVRNEKIGSEGRRVPPLRACAVPGKNYHGAQDMKSGGYNVTDCTKKLKNFQKIIFITSIKSKAGH